MFKDPKYEAYDILAKACDKVDNKDKQVIDILIDAMYYVLDLPQQGDYDGK